jgi:hypothetical protein
MRSLSLRDVTERIEEGLLIEIDAIGELFSHAVFSTLIIVSLNPYSSQKATLPMREGSP